MNRAKRHEAEKAAAALQQLVASGLTHEEARVELSKRAIMVAATEWLRSKLFSEEHEHVYDSTAEAAERKNGRNPMNADYVKRMDAKREALGIPPLTTSGLAAGDEAREYLPCHC
ncbi:hypothetical protein [Cupriavidus respiraculi]|uniref:hypothetical protein n=1 Tax=Cupriavidus respiraculi TaxID=195930 RepID=UPI001C971E1D|nr:hypothetical protein [Cupriavidus respiraculi]MBY4949507.1 hypothetical protein [Cupriavidus respiraculi]